MTKKKKAITYGKQDVLSDDDFKNPKIRISIMVDEDVILAFKKRARDTGEGYQTLMHRALKAAVGQGMPEMPQFTKSFEMKLEELDIRLKEVERKKTG
jgi:hypothetical protein